VFGPPPAAASGQHAPVFGPPPAAASGQHAPVFGPPPSAASGQQAPVFGPPPSAASGPQAPVFGPPPAAASGQHAPVFGPPPSAASGQHAPVFGPPPSAASGPQAPVFGPPPSAASGQHAPVFGPPPTTASGAHPRARSTTQSGPHPSARASGAHAAALSSPSGAYPASTPSSPGGPAPAFDVAVLEGRKGLSQRAVIALGVGGAVLVAAVIAGVGAILVGGDRAPAPTASATASAAPPAPPPPAPAAVSVGIKDIQFFKTPRDAQRYIVAELLNLGATPLSSPHAKITLLDGTKNVLETVLCAQPNVSDLQQNESVPCAASLAKAVDWKSYEIETRGEAVPAGLRSADLKISELQSTGPRSKLGAHKVTGKVTNRSPFAARRVWVVVGLYDKEGKIAGTGSVAIERGDIEPGQTRPFTLNVYHVAAPVTKAFTKVFGYDR
jgi:hypothetical protein